MLEPFLPSASPSFAERIVAWRGTAASILRDCWFCGHSKERGAAHLPSSPFPMRPLVRPRAWSSEEFICGVPCLVVPSEFPLTVVLPANCTCVDSTSDQGDWRVTHVEAAVSCMNYCVETIVPSHALPVALLVMQPVLVCNKHGLRVHMIVIDP